MSALAVAERASTLERDGLVPVASGLAEVLPQGGLRRGTTVTVAGSQALLLALLAPPAELWAAAVGLPHLGLVAAAEAGVALERLALIPSPGRNGAAVAAALLEAFDLVALPAGAVTRSELRRLQVRARNGRAVLLLTADVHRRWTSEPAGGQAGPVVDGTSLGEVDSADVRLAVTRSVWEGLGDGHGHLRARRVEVEVSGRGAAARPRRGELWLPAPDGGSVGIRPRQVGTEPDTARSAA